MGATLTPQLCHAPQVTAHVARWNQPAHTMFRDIAAMVVEAEPLPHVVPLHDLSQHDAVEEPIEADAEQNACGQRS
jgi:hypothetical protein